MKIEKITENKIRIVIDLDEIKSKNIDLEDFMMNNIESQKFFLEILNKAEKEIGFKTNNCKLLIETFSSLNDFFVFTITKFSDHPKKSLNVNSKYTRKKAIFKNPIYQFSSFEEFCNLCEFLNKSKFSINGISKKISLYLYNNTYYLVFSYLNLSCKNLKKLFSILGEFSTVVRKSNSFEARLVEYGQPIIKQNAFKTGIKYFV